MLYTHPISTNFENGPINICVLRCYLCAFFVTFFVFWSSCEKYIPKISRYCKDFRLFFQNVLVIFHIIHDNIRRYAQITHVERNSTPYEHVLRSFSGLWGNPRCKIFRHPDVRLSILEAFSVNVVLLENTRHSSRHVTLRLSASSAVKIRSPPLHT